jgi:hypothetical protein
LIEEFTRAGTRVEFVKRPRGDSPEDQVRRPSRQRCTIAAARVQRRHFNPGGPLRGLVKEPVGHHFSAPPGNDVDEFNAMQVNDSGGKHGGLDRTGASEGSLIIPDARAAAATA